MNRKNKIKIKNTVIPKNAGKKWIAVITVISFVLSILMDVLSTTLIPEANISVALVLLLVLIFIGVIFDIIGIAVATADETPFHSMASKRVKAAPQAIRLIRNADKVSNICNDVVGDIVGIISGAATAVIVTKIVVAYGFDKIFLSLMLTGTVASLTIAGKAVGKGIGMNNANSIVYAVALVIHIFIKPKKHKKS